jgi:hypothetical protein
MDKICLYRLGRGPETRGTGCLLPVWAVLFSLAAGATTDATAEASLFHYGAGGFSYEISLRPYEGSGQPPPHQTNTPPQALSRIITAAAYEDTIVPLSAKNADDGSVVFFLTSLPPTGKVYQYAGKARGALIQPGAAVSDPKHRVIFAPTPSGSGAPESHFDFVANDSNGVSAPATVTVNVLPPEPPRFIDVRRVPGGPCRLLFEGHGNTAYLISASSDLINWEDIGVPAQLGSELFGYEDQEAPQFANRFYRVRVSDTPPPPALTAVKRQSDGSYSITFSGGAYWPHSVWASSDLFEWRRLGAAEETAAGRFQFADKEASNMAHRFYRASRP